MLSSKDLISHSVKYECITPSKLIMRLFGASDLISVRHRLPNALSANGITYMYSHGVSEMQEMVCTGILDALEDNCEKYHSAARKCNWGLSLCMADTFLSPQRTTETVNILCCSYTMLLN